MAQILKFLDGNLAISFDKTQRVLDTLEIVGDASARNALLDKLREYRSLCSTWNLAAKLMSNRDLADRFDDHIADSLTLVNEFLVFEPRDFIYVDIGSGGGFPAIPLSLLGVAPQTHLIERSATKASFLKFTVARLELPTAVVAQGEFPCIGIPETTRIFTARATESPERVDRFIADGLRAGDLYLAQRKPHVPSHSASVEEIVDRFSNTYLRRGVAYHVRK